MGENDTFFFEIRRYSLFFNSFHPSFVMAHWIHALKDAALATAARQFLASKIQPFGSLEALKIDSVTRRIDLTLSLEGESEPVHIQVVDYRFFEENDALLLHLAPDSFSTNRVWLTRLLNRQLTARSFHVPDSLAPWLRQLAGRFLINFHMA